MNAEAALGILVNMLKDKAITFKNLKDRAKAELGKLQDELSLLQARLKDAGEMNNKTYAFKEIEKQIRKLVYEVEDTIEYCLTKKAVSENTKNVWVKFKAYMSSKLEEKVKSLREESVASALKLLTPPPEEMENKVKSLVEEGLANALKSRTRPLEKALKDVDEEMDDSDVESKYRKLRPDLKTCFLYTGLFPQNYEIPASTLTQLWIAERFIQPVDGKTLEKSAEDVLKDLIGEKLLTAEKTRLEEVKTCKVDDIIRQFCMDKAKEQNLFTVIEPPVHEGQNLYRLCFHSDPSAFLSEEPTLNGPYVRSFLCLLKKPLGLDPKHVSTIPKAFKPLRVLNCESTKLDELPDIQKLALLKHVTLFIKKLDFLPVEISNLLNLQTLIVKTNSDCIQVKANIWTMTQLRHLKTKVFFIMDNKKWNGRAARNLQTLSRLSPKSCTEDLHEKAPNLKKLGIRGELDDILMNFSLKKFTHLENLTLENYLHYGSARTKPLQWLPNLQALPLNLKKLSLSKTHLKWNYHMEELAKIHTLEVLKVKDDAFEGLVWTVRIEFPNLRYLLIEDTDLVTWEEASPGRFPKLKWLVIKECRRLDKLPDSLKQVKLELVE